MGSSFHMSVQLHAKMSTLITGLITILATAAFDS